MNNTFGRRLLSFFARCISAKTTEIRSKPQETTADTLQNELKELGCEIRDYKNRTPLDWNTVVTEMLKQY